MIPGSSLCCLPVPFRPFLLGACARHLRHRRVATSAPSLPDRIVANQQAVLDVREACGTILRAAPPKLHRGPSSSARSIPQAPRSAVLEQHALQASPTSCKPAGTAPCTIPALTGDYPLIVIGGPSSVLPRARAWPVGVPTSPRRGRAPTPALMYHYTSRTPSPFIPLFDTRDRGSLVSVYLASPRRTASRAGSNPEWDRWLRTHPCRRPSASAPPLRLVESSSINCAARSRCKKRIEPTREAESTSALSRPRPATTVSGASRSPATDWPPSSGHASTIRTTVRRAEISTR